MRSQVVAMAAFGGQALAYGKLRHALLVYQYKVTLMLRHFYFAFLCCCELFQAPAFGIVG